MIVDCESCHTRFKLDESRIPATGAKVRCSRCKTAFIVKRPNITREAVIAEVVAEATDPGAQAAPETTDDLFEASTNIDFSPQPASAPGTMESETGDEKWEFDETPRPSFGTHAAPTAATPVPREAHPTAPEVRREDDDLDSLGSPAEWDLLGGGARRVAAEASFKASPARVAEPQATPARPQAAPEASIDAALTAAAARAPEREAQTPDWRDSFQSALGRAVEGAGWIAASVLCAIGLALAVAPLPLPSAAPAAPSAAEIGGASVELSIHSLENAVAGNLTIVRGELPASAVSRKPERLRASWVDASGKPVAGATAIAGPPLAIRELREFSLARLQADHTAHALELTAGGAFEAVFGALPPGAKRIAITREAARPAANPAVAAAEPENSGATSSRPTARPSSE